ncbi:unnamed protein product [Cuscuta epithymum]|uniref:Uncharacterized protein n=3 Tax=Cuscuta epithymum TaxID=186058 RepID=A0AAV0FKN7_9ASTE|nr:unnamed protein product [Cuscuta epithymum]
MPAGDIMDPKAFAKLTKKLAKEPRKKKEEGSSANQPPVDEVLKKAGAPKVPEGGDLSQKPVADSGAGAGGSQDGELKRKNAGKGVLPPEKKKKRGEGGKDAPLVIIDEPPSGKPSDSLPQVDLDEGAWPLEKVQFPIKKGTAIMHGTLDPREFLRGATPSLDRSTLGKFEDESLELKALQASVTSSIALGELVRRAEQRRVERARSEEAMRKLIANNTEAIRQLAGLEEALRQSEQRLEAAKNEARAEGIANGKAEAEKTAAEAAKAAAEEADKAKADAVAKATEDAVASFVADGWRAEEYQQWVASVVEAKADAWVKGPGAMWLALKGKSFYEGAQYFTQAMLYRRLARHHGVDPKEFQPEAYGLPPFCRT